MSTTNENILKSLAVLEQNLKDINTAKEQVNNVVKTSGNLAKVIESYQVSFESLSINVKSVLEDSRKFNLDSIAKLSEQTNNFSKEISKLTEFDVSKSLNTIESETIKQFQQYLSKPLEGLENHIKNFEKEVVKLIEYDFQDSFINLEKQVINQFNIDFKEKLVSLDNKAEEMQSKIDDFKLQILRIENVDFELHFSDMLTTIINHSDEQNIVAAKNQEELKIQVENILSNNIQQVKEYKTLKTLVVINLGILIMIVVLAFKFFKSKF